MKYAIVFFVSWVISGVTYDYFQPDYKQAMLSMVDRYQELANETPIHTTCIKQARACKYYYATYRGE